MPADPTHPQLEPAYEPTLQEGVGPAPSKLDHMTATNEARAEDPAGATSEADASSGRVTANAAATATTNGRNKAAADGKAPTPRRRNNAITIIIEALGALVQLVLVYAGLRYLIVDDETLNEQARLLAWCAIATIYLAGTVFWLNIDLRVNDDDHRFMRRTSRHPLVAVFSAIVTFSSSLVGLSAAVTVIVGPEDPDYFNLYDLVAVWAMLASWAMFHWGYSRIYYAAYHNRQAEKPLIFPGTEHPRLIDFVYFSFINGTSFAPSDVMVATTRMRWTVVWHATFSFFFNALIIVLTMNTISGGFKGLE